MKLYVYDHCPFCVRAEMAAYYKKVPVERVVLLNDDVATPMRLINAKQVPILEFDDGTAMAESLDIVNKCDEIGEKSQIIQAQTEKTAEINQFINTASDAIYNLLFPRNVKAGLPEFATQAAIDYFTKKKQLIINKSFEQAMRESKTHKATVEAMLAALQILPKSYDTQIGYDDIFVFPTLRNLTLVKDLIIPNSIKLYIEKISKLTDVALYYDRAL